VSLSESATGVRAETSVDCILRIDLLHAGSGNMNSNAQGLTGLTFDVVGSIVFDNSALSAWAWGPAGPGGLAVVGRRV
jgi:hypothetical protein